MSRREKICPRCQGTGPFAASGDREDGLDGVCKKCRKEYSDRPENKARQKKYRDENKARGRALAIAARYGLTVNAYNELLVVQQNKCAVCMTLLDSSTAANTPHIDHCHYTEKVRGILCTRCNIMLGMSLDDVTTLLRGAQYLFNRQPREISEILKNASQRLSNEVDSVVASAEHTKWIRRTQEDSVGMEINSLTEEEAIAFWEEHADYQTLMFVRQFRACGLKTKKPARYSSEKRRKVEGL